MQQNVKALEETMTKMKQCPAEVLVDTFLSLIFMIWQIVCATSLFLERSGAKPDAQCKELPLARSCCRF